MINNFESLIKRYEILMRDTGNRDGVSFATFEIAPLERGFDTTLGNSLRRVLLSSIVGAAITSVKIPGVLHEFSNVEGVNEDVIEIVLNIKDIVLKVHDDCHTRTLRLKAHGPTVVTAGMISPTAGVSVVNPEHVICTISSERELDMEFTFDIGRGYRPAPKFVDDRPVGTIFVDAIFSPVRVVAFKPEDTRLGNVTDYGKLILTIETNGAVTPKDALAHAAKILHDQLSPFVALTNTRPEADVQSDMDLPFNPLLLKKVEDLGLSARSCNCLKNDNIVYVGDLVTQQEEDISRLPNFGKKSLMEIKCWLVARKLDFGMVVESWPPPNIEELIKKIGNKLDRY